MQNEECRKGTPAKRNLAQHRAHDLAFHPSEYLIDELIARGISRETFEERAQLTPGELAEFCARKIQVTHGFAAKLDRGLRGTGRTPGIEIWLRLQDAWDRQEWARQAAKTRAHKAQVRRGNLKYR